MSASRTTVVAIAAALALTSCATSDRGDGTSTQPTASSPPPSAGPAQGSGPASHSPSGRGGTSTGTSATAAAIPAPPRDGACYRLDFDEATEPTSDNRRVGCGRRHTAQTYYVGRLDTVVDGHLLAVDSRLAQRRLQRTCPRRLAEYLGGTSETRALSRLEAVWFSPTIEQSDDGASWFRCDTVALARAGKLAPLPPPRRLRGILDRPGALDVVGLCGTAAPGARGFERVICSRPHAWQALSTIRISGGDEYPGVAEVREAGEGACRDQVEAASGSPDRFSFGWEWPTRAQWRAGQRFGYCWAPD